MQTICMILDNVTHKYTMGKSEYLLLIKKQKDKPYSMMYITDCESNFWFKLLNHEQMTKIKTDLRLNSPLDTFCSYFLKGINTSSTIQIVDTDDSQNSSNKDTLIKLIIGLQLGAGLQMSCNVLLENRINMKQTDNFRTILKIFFKQLYEAKEYQIEQCRKEPSIPNKLPAIQAVQSNYISDILQKKPLSKNLMNPNRRKRKGVGLKFGE